MGYQIAGIICSQLHWILVLDDPGVHVQQGRRRTAFSPTDYALYDSCVDFILIDVYLVYSMQNIPSPVWM